MSGGNQQKVVIAREVSRDPSVLVAAQPTRGLDVGAIEFVHRRLVEQRDAGKAVLLVSLELEEILSLSDRILVLYEGRIVAEFPPDVSEEELGIAMTGGTTRGGSVSEGDAPTGSAPTPQAPLESDPEAYAPIGRRASSRSTSAPAGSSRRCSPPSSRSWWAESSCSRPVTTRCARTRRSSKAPGSTGSSTSATTTSISPFTNHHIWFWWDTNTNHTAAYNLTQTLLTTTPLILTGLAVAFAFRCGLFNIGGQGQYLIGAIVGVYVGSRFTDMAHLPHVIFGLTAAALAGALWGSIAGFLKATVGAHEVITTIMLNWIAYWGGSYLFGRGGPLQNHVNQAVPISDDVAPGAKLAAIWGNPHLQALHSGIFIALGALVVFYIILNRTTLGYEVRAVGFNPEAARYGGISVARNFIIAMAISGLFAGLAGGIDILGWQFRLGVLDVQVSNIGFIGIAVALLGRNTAVGVGLAALLFGGLLTGTSTRSLDPQIFPPAARRESHPDDPGPRAALRRRGRADPLHLAGAQEGPHARTAAAQPTRPHERDGVRRTRPGEAGPAT